MIARIRGRPALRVKRPCDANPKGRHAMDIIETLEHEEIARLNKTIPDFAPGDTVIVNVNVVEGERRARSGLRRAW